MFVDLRCRDFLQFTQQVVIQRFQPVLLAQLLGQVGRQVGGHFRIGHGPVSLPGVGQVGKGGQGAQLVVGCGGHQPPGQQQRAGKVLQTGALDAAHFKVPELLVKRRVVCHQRGNPHELVDLVHHPIGRRRGAQHGVADAGQLLDKPRHPHAGVHQALVTLDDAPLFKYHHGNFSGPARTARRKPGGFKVDDRNAFQT